MGDAADAVKKVATAPAKVISKIPGGFINKIIALLFISLVILGGFMYFGVSAGTKDVQFVDLQVKVGSVALSPAPNPELPLFSHSIESVSGFSEVGVYGKVKALVDIDNSDVWVAARVTLNGYCQCDPAGCNRIYFTESYSYPQTGYMLIENLGGMKKGEVRPFKFTLTKQQIENYLIRASAGKIEKGGDYDYLGRVYVAIIVTHQKGTRRGTTYGYDVVTNPSAITKLKEVKAFEWEFNAHKYNGFHSIFVTEDGLDWPGSNSIVELPTQSAEISLKVSNSAAVLTLSFIVLSMALLSLGVVKWSDVSLWVKLLLFIVIIAVILLIPRLFGG